MTDAPDSKAETPFRTTTATLDGPIGKRGLLVYPVSINSAAHTDDNFYFSMKAIRQATLAHSNTEYPNFVLQVTDLPYARTFQMWDKNLSDENAKEMAAAAGQAWIDKHIGTATDIMGFRPLVFRWSNWREQHREEYDEALAAVQTLYAKKDSPFHAAIDKDANRFVHRIPWRRRDDSDISPVDPVADPVERARIYGLSVKFLEDETAGYVVLARHITDDYMQALDQHKPRIAEMIRENHGLTDGVFRMYPSGGFLESIEWLQKNKNNRGMVPSALRGTERLHHVEIKLREHHTSNADVFRAPAELNFEAAWRRTMRRNHPDSANGSGTAPTTPAFVPEVPGQDRRPGVA